MELAGVKVLEKSLLLPSVTSASPALGCGVSAMRVLALTGTSVYRHQDTSYQLKLLLRLRTCMGGLLHFRGAVWAWEVTTALCAKLRARVHGENVDPELLKP